MAGLAWVAPGLMLMAAIGCRGGTAFRIGYAGGLAFYLTYRRPASACGPGDACEMPKANRLGKMLLWLVTFVVVLAATFPYYSRYLF